MLSILTHFARFSFIVLALVLVALVSPPTNTSVIEQFTMKVEDSLALVALYQSTNGPEWKSNDNWLQSRASKWKGVRTGVDENGEQRVLELSLNSNNLSGPLPEELGNLKLLRECKLSYNNGITTIPLSIGQLKDLEELWLVQNNIEVVPPTIGDLEKLELLHLEDNQISVLPDEIGNLSNLESFSVGGNLLENIPESIGELIGLKRLGLEENKLIDFPVAICNLSFLEGLGIGDNFIQVIPLEIEGLSNLEYVNIKGNLLTIFPETVGNLSKLKRLNAENNQLNGLPDSFCELENLEELILKDNQIQILPDCINDLQKLRNLQLDRNQLQTLPTSINDLARLMYFSLDNNQLIHFPITTDSQLQNLEGIGLQDNELVILPEAIWDLPALDWLNCANNQLQELSLHPTNPSFPPNLFVEGNLLDFSDLSPITTLEPPIQWNNFIYHPQDSLGSPLDTTLLVGDFIQLSAPNVGPNSNYFWYKDGHRLPDATGLTLMIELLSEEQAGEYYCKMYDPNVPDLVLITHSQKVRLLNETTKVKVQVFLEGAYAGNGQMHSHLRQKQLLIGYQPFTVLPWHYFGSESLPEEALYHLDWIDWVLLELRHPDDPTLVIMRKAGLLLSNGSVVDVDGTEGISMQVPYGNTPYYLAIRQRNHLDILSAHPLTFSSQRPIDFTHSADQAFGEQQLKELEDGIYGLYAGDISRDGLITVEDINIYQEESATIYDYSKADLNLDGNITVGDFNYLQPNLSMIGVDPIRN